MVAPPPVAPVAPVAPAVPAAPPPGGTLREQALLIAREIHLPHDESTSAGALIIAANEMMGLPREGTLPEQVRRLREAVGC